MKEHASEASIQEMANVLKVSRSGYYKFLAGAVSPRAQANDTLLLAIQESHAASHERYGSPRIHKDLCAAGHTCSRNRVARLMQKAGIQAKMKKKFKVTTQVDSKLPAAPNHLKQDFKAEAPNEKWVSDITYVWTREGWLYVAVILDLFSRKVVGMAMADRLKKELAMVALRQALTRRDGQAPRYHHSDKGCQYTSKAFQALLKTHGIICSMSGTGNCFDNAVAESFFHTLKTEHIYFENYATRDQAKTSIFEYVEIFYNNQRRHSFLDYVSPVEFEKRYRTQSGVSLSSVH